MCTHAADLVYITHGHASKIVSTYTCVCSTNKMPVVHKYNCSLLMRHRAHCELRHGSELSLAHVVRSIMSCSAAFCVSHCTVAWRAYTIILPNMKCISPEISLFPHHYPYQFIHHAICEHVASKYIILTNLHVQGRIQGFGKGGGPINIFTTGGGYGRGRAPSRDSKGVWGSVDSSPSGVWGEAPAAFCFCVYLA